MAQSVGYDTKQTDGKARVLLALWVMLLLPGQLWSGVEAPIRVLSMDQIEQNCVPMLNWIVPMYKMNLALNNL